MLKLKKVNSTKNYSHILINNPIKNNIKSTLEPNAIEPESSTTTQLFKNSDKYIVKYFKKQIMNLSQSLISKNNNIEQSQPVPVQKKPKKSYIKKIRETFTKKQSKPNKKKKSSSVDIPENIHKKSQEDQIISLRTIFPCIREEDFTHIYVNKGIIREGKKVVKLNQYTKIYNNYNSKYKKLENDYKTKYFKPCIRCSSAFILPDDAVRQADNNNKKKWVSKKYFKLYFDKHSKRKYEQDNYKFLNYSMYDNRALKKDNIKDYYVSVNKGIEYVKSDVLGFHFRNIDKSKWVCNKDFLCQ